MKDFEIGKNQFYIKKEDFKKYNLEQIIMQKTISGNFKLDVIENPENYQIIGAMISY